MPYHAFVDPDKLTSGQRFYVGLSKQINSYGTGQWGDAQTVLFNVSVPLSALFRAWISRKLIVLRVDGLYFDEVTPDFLKRFSWPLRLIISMLKVMPGRINFAGHFANLIDQNWTGFLRMLFADYIVYQSEYSKNAYKVYFPHKPGAVIVNGASLAVTPALLSQPTSDFPIRLLTTFDEWRPSKRVVELIHFVKWANEIRGISLHLTIIGYTGRFPAGSPKDLHTLVETSPFFSTHPRYVNYDEPIRSAMLGSDMFITLSYRDACPNVVVEAMAHGLPVVGCDSGGIPDIVGDAGRLFSSHDPGQHFSPSRFDSHFPSLSYEEIIRCIVSVKKDLALYRKRVFCRFAVDLDMEIVGKRYMTIMKSLVEKRQVKA